MVMRRRRRHVAREAIASQGVPDQEGTLANRNVVMDIVGHGEVRELLHSTNVLSLIRFSTSVVAAVWKPYVDLLWVHFITINPFPQVVLLSPRQQDLPGIRKNHKCVRVSLGNLHCKPARTRNTAKATAQRCGANAAGV